MPGFAGDLPVERLVRLFELKTCSEFNLKSLIYGNFDSGGGF
jgi:hypothetical protein